MTPEQIEFHRKRFEKWFCGDLDVNPKRDASGNYTFMNAHAAWKAWIAAIESIEIELPEKHATERHDDEWAFNRAIERCEDAIQLLGLKVKER